MSQKTMTIWKEFTFEAAHFLPNVPNGHKCSRMHGHSYRVRIEVTGEVGDDGMVMDFERIKEAWAPLRLVLDHRTLNDILANPTSENVAQLIAATLRLPGLSAVEVSETGTSGVRLAL